MAARDLKFPRRPADDRGACSKDFDTAAAGMAAQQQRLDAVANDLANVEHDRLQARPRRLPRPRLPQAGRSSASGVRTGAGAAAVDAGRSFAQGALQRTDRPLDVAIQGEGFLAVRLPDGRQALTRDGSLHSTAAAASRPAPATLVQPPITIPAGTPRTRSRSAPTARSPSTAAASAASTS